MPIDTLTSDELGSIFQHLDLISRCKALCVSKSLYAFGTAEPDLWRFCDFGSSRSMRDEDVARVLDRGASRVTLVRILDSPDVTCLALRSLKSCVNLKHLSLTGCCRINARGLLDAFPTEVASRFSSLKVDGIAGLNDQTVLQLKSKVVNGKLDVTQCDGCEEYANCHGCSSLGCESRHCQSCVRYSMHCDNCDTFWCADCEDGHLGDINYCDGCLVGRCEECAFKDDHCMHFCSGCHDVRCEDCAFKDGHCVHYCGGCHEPRCNDCAYKDGHCMHYCGGCHEPRCNDCAYKDGHCMHYCMSCHESRCEKCFADPCCPNMFADY